MSDGGASNERVGTVVLGDGRRIRARVWAGSGRPLVLLHGMPSSAATWRPVTRLTDRYCIALDLPGFGASSPARAARLESYADDVIEALDALGVRRCTLVGHSFGGGVAMAVAGRSGSVDELVLLAPGGHGDCGLVRVALDPGVGAVLRASVACSGAFASRPAPTEVPCRRTRIRLLLSELRRAAVAGFANGRTAVLANEREVTHGEVVRACAEHFTGRVAVVWGREDRVLPVKQAHAVHRALQGSVLHLLEGTGHALHRERADAILAIVAGVS